PERATVPFAVPGTSRYSIWQFASQPLPGPFGPMSHASPSSTTLLPQTGQGGLPAQVASSQSVSPLASSSIPLSQISINVQPEVSIWHPAQASEPELKP